MKIGRTSRYRLKKKRHRHWHRQMYKNIDGNINQNKFEGDRVIYQSGSEMHQKIVDGENYKFVCLRQVRTC